MSRDSSVSIVTMLQALVWPEFWCPAVAGKGFSLFTITFRLDLGSTQTLIQWVLGACFSGCKVARTWSWPLCSI